VVDGLPDGAGERFWFASFDLLSAEDGIVDVMSEAGLFGDGDVLLADGTRLLGPKVGNDVLDDGARPLRVRASVPSIACCGSLSDNGRADAAAGGIFLQGEADGLGTLTGGKPAAGVLIIVDCCCKRRSFCETFLNAGLTGEAPGG
jgi:hypothetical protein